VQVLEILAGPEARRLLEGLAKGPGEARQAREAREALDRLSREWITAP
jgi:hypothetical protein